MTSKEVFEMRVKVHYTEHDSHVTMCDLTRKQLDKNNLVSEHLEDCTCIDCLHILHGIILQKLEDL